MISAREIRKRFGALQVLSGVDLDIAPGQVTALVGPNASGKTTFNRIILGLVRRDHGEIFFDGVPLDSSASYRSRVGYMPQVARFPENLTAEGLMRMLTDLRGRTVRRDEELIELLELGPVLRTPLRVLSGGTRQRINAALAFLFSPDFLILDEPTAGLDPVSSSVLKDKILRDRAAGRTFVVTSHVLSELEELADSIAFLLDGVVRFHGTTADLKLATGQATLERAVAHLIKSNALTASRSGAGRTGRGDVA
jgi:Cu-processing system ATP-binding protein